MSTTVTDQAPLTVCALLTRAGSPTQLATALTELTGKHVTPQRVAMWRIRNSIPPKWVRPVSRVTGYPASLINPDLYAD